MKNSLHSVVLTLATVALGACASGDRAPETAPLGASDLPAAWTEAGVSGALAASSDYWGAYGSDELSTLVGVAQQANPDLAVAAERVLQAQAQLRMAQGAQFPTLSAGAETGRRETRAPGGPWVGENSSSASLNAGYEVDLWGRLAAGGRAAAASLQASRYDHETVRLALESALANGYFQLLSLRERLVVAQQNQVIAQRVLKVVDARVRFGAASALDLARQQAAVLTLQASFTALQLQERQTLYALALLVGRAPEGFTVAGETLAPVLVPQVASGLPAALLERRPDIASAQAQLAAAHANVAAARAALLPSISLTAAAGLASNALINFLNSPSASLALGASVLQPIFDGGRLRAQVDVASSQQRALVQGYRKLIFGALAEVESALAAGSQALLQAQLQQQVVEQTRHALQLAEVRYREGADDVLILLDAQRTLFQAEDQLAQLRLARLLASVSLFKALGGPGSANL